MKLGPPGAVFLKVDFLVVFCLRSGPDGSGQPLGFIWTKFQAKLSILDQFRAKFDVFGPTRSLVSQDLGLAWLWTSPIAAGKPDRDFNIRLVSTADICPVSAADIRPVSAADICPVSTEDIYPVSTEDGRK